MDFVPILISRKSPSDRHEHSGDSWVGVHRSGQAQVRWGPRGMGMFEPDPAEGSGGQGLALVLSSLHPRRGCPRSGLRCQGPGDIWAGCRGLRRLSSGEGPGAEDNLGVVSLGDIYSPGSNDITSWRWARGSRLSSCVSHPAWTPACPLGSQGQGLHWTLGARLTQAARTARNVHRPGWLLVCQGTPGPRPRVAGQPQGKAAGMS